MNDHALPPIREVREGGWTVRVEEALCGRLLDGGLLAAAEGPDLNPTGPVGRGQHARLDLGAKLAEAGIRTFRAAALRDWAEAHLARGEAADSERAIELYREALSEYEDMGATGWIERVQTRLAEIEE